MVPFGQTFSVVVCRADSCSVHLSAMGFRRVGKSPPLYQEIMPPAPSLNVLTGAARCRPDITLWTVQWTFSA